MAINIPFHAESAFFMGTLSLLAATLRSGATDGAGALVELDSAIPAPHSPQNRVPEAITLPQVGQNMFKSPFSNKSMPMPLSID